ncbi:MAG: hypothetical protein ABIF85_04845 [Nanoarchaeota archaeon]|nr:hypothetical protein [Nanoarchaeota archaeon]MBU4299914.1 hypothetical protein [Nanoarchaeota archaeon]MBU4452215.1 hypothetical protein [Nanoarchaeota archaeon]MCG2724569.1 hypothetical protein [archaeon]
MNLTDWMTSKIRKFDWADISLTKISVFSFALMAAKLWAPLLSLEWHWYAVIFVLAAIRPLYKVFAK